MRKRTIDTSPTPGGIWLTSDMALHLKDVQPVGQKSNIRIRYMYHILISTSECDSSEIWRKGISELHIMIRISALF